MAAPTGISFLAAELAEVERMLSKLPERAITSRFSLQNRKSDIEERISLLRENPLTSAFVRLLFSGGPVLDSRAIDATFAADAIHNYQDIITKITASKKGDLANFGPVAESMSQGSRFNIVGIERGSFGFALEEKTVDASTAIFDTSLKDVIEEVSSTLERLCDSDDEEYGSLVGGMDKRLFNSFKKFFALLVNNKAQVKIADRENEQMFDSAMVAKAFDRIKQTKVTEVPVEVRGYLQGLTPYSNVFDFLSENGAKITGKVDPVFSAEYKTQIDQGEYLQPGRFFKAALTKKTTLRQDATLKTSFKLVGLVDADATTGKEKPDETDS